MQTGNTLFISPIGLINKVLQVFMSDSITLQEASVLWLKSFDKKSAFWSEQLFAFLYNVRGSKKFNGIKIANVRINANLDRLFELVISHLEERELIQSTKSRYYLIKNRPSQSLEIVCSLYPNGYASYLTAMKVYNLTDRFPKAIDFVAPTRNEWKKAKNTSLLENEIEGSSFSPSDFAIAYPSEILRFNRKKLNVYTRKELLPYITRGENVRVIDIGCLFLEMLRYPELCGGFQHVYEIFEEMGEAFQNEILSATEKYGSNIDKVRIGYIFEKHLDITNSIINRWKSSSVSRGGSRKMIADSPYSDIYDETWCISLNHAIFQ